MATADEYAQWIVNNADKRGTPDFEIVAKAYQDARAATQPTAQPAAQPKQSPLDVPNAVATGYNKGLLSLAGLPVDTAANIRDLVKAGIGAPYTAITGKPAPDWLQVQDRANDIGSGAHLIKTAQKYAPTMVTAANPEYEGGYLQAAGGGLNAIMNPNSRAEAINQGALGLASAPRTTLQATMRWLSLHRYHQQLRNKPLWQAQNTLSEAAKNAVRKWRNVWQTLKRQALRIQLLGLPLVIVLSVALKTC
jgi:hypothetical protein